MNGQSLGRSHECQLEELEMARMVDRLIATLTDSRMQRRLLFNFLSFMDVRIQQRADKLLVIVRRGPPNCYQAVGDSLGLSRGQSDMVELLRVVRQYSSGLQTSDT